MRLLVLNGPSEGRQIHLVPGAITIGRKENCDIVLDDRYVSGAHAEILLDETGEVYISDLGSSNGSFLLGEPVTRKTRVASGDVFHVGHTFIKLTRRTVERYNADDAKTAKTPEAIIVIDLVGSSKIAQALGDSIASKVKNLLSEKIGAHLVNRPAEYMKNTGDGYMIIMTKSHDAVMFSLELMRDLVGDGAYRGFHIRIGIHYGETMRLPDGDRRGMAVDMAFRVEGVKVGEMHETTLGVKKDTMPRVDRIFISEAVHRAVGSNAQINARCIGFFDLKGFNGRHKLFEVLP